MKAAIIAIAALAAILARPVIGLAAEAAIDPHAEVAAALFAASATQAATERAAN